MPSRPIACLAGAFAMFLSACSDEDVVRNTPRAVRTITVQSEVLGETYSQTGEIRPRYEVPMSFRVEGQLAFRLENGSAVKEGDTLATLEKATSLINVASATAQVDASKADVALAEKVAARNWELFPKNAISEAQLQQGDYNLHAARAKLDIANAALDNAQQSLSYTDIKAGRVGVVSGVSANVGQVVSAGQTILTLSSNNELDAVFDIPEQLWNANLNGTDVDVTLISNPDRVIKGKVREVTPSADAATRTYRIKTTLEGLMDGLPMGAAVTGKVILFPKRIFKLPSSALTRLNEDQAVYLYNPATKTLKVQVVKVERYMEKEMFVSDGLVDGDIVVTAGVSKLRNGEAVTIEKGDL